MGRPRESTAGQDAEILRLHAAEGLGTLRIAKKLGLRRSLVWRVLHRTKPTKALPGSPAVGALPVEPQHETRALPLPADHGRCKGCGKPAALQAAELCAECMADLTARFGTRPVARGLCYRCGKRDIVLGIVAKGAGYIEGLCLEDWWREQASMAADSEARYQRQHAEELPDSRGLAWDGTRGFWKAI